MPQIFDLLQDPQERYDLFMNIFTEMTWSMVDFGASIKKLMTTYVQYPPRKSQSLTYSGPITLSQYREISVCERAVGERRLQPADFVRQLIICEWSWQLRFNPSRF